MNQLFRRSLGHLIPERAHDFFGNPFDFFSRHSHSSAIMATHWAGKGRKCPARIIGPHPYHRWCRKPHPPAKIPHQRTPLSSTGASYGGGGRACQASNVHQRGCGQLRGDWPTSPPHPCTAPGLRKSPATGAGLKQSVAHRAGNSRQSIKTRSSASKTEISRAASPRTNVWQTVTRHAPAQSRLTTSLRPDHSIQRSADHTRDRVSPLPR